MSRDYLEQGVSTAEEKTPKPLQEKLALGYQVKPIHPLVFKRIFFKHFSWGVGIVLFTVSLLSDGYSHALFTLLSIFLVVLIQALNWKTPSIMVELRSLFLLGMGVLFDSIALGRATTLWKLPFFLVLTQLLSIVFFSASWFLTLHISDYSSLSNNILTPASDKTREKILAYQKAFDLTPYSLSNAPKINKTLLQSVDKTFIRVYFLILLTPFFIMGFMSLLITLSPIPLAISVNAILYLGILATLELIILLSYSLELS